MSDIVDEYSIDKDVWQTTTTVQLLHEAEDDAVKWLESITTAAFAKWMNIWVVQNSHYTLKCWLLLLTYLPTYLPYSFVILGVIIIY